MSRITVTGAEGFIGKHLCRELSAAGHDVHGIDRRDGDLTQPGEAAYLIQRASPDIVVHLAAQVGRQFGEADAGFTIRQNATMTAHVAKWTQSMGARLVVASSSEIYGDMGTELVDETVTPRLPYNLYGLTKRWAEEVAQLYSHDVAIVRLAMPFGPGLPPGKGRAAIINFLADAHHGREITVHADSERCWCWIGDTVWGIRLVAESDKQGAFNVGRDDNAVTMRRVAELAKKITKSSSEIKTVLAPANQVLVKRLGTKRLRGLGWKPTVDLETGMRRTYKFMLENGQLEVSDGREAEGTREKEAAGEGGAGTRV